MRLVPISCVIAVLAAPPAAAVAGQGHGSHAAAVMGFDQDQTSHHFFIYPDGGAIEVSAKQVADSRNRDAIRTHLPHVAAMFGSGNFSAPMLIHDSENVPGATILAARKDAIRYRYSETPAGGRVNIHTTDRDALDALHAFLRFQIAEHKTGDSTTVQPR